MAIFFVRNLAVRLISEHTTYQTTTILPSLQVLNVGYKTTSLETKYALHLQCIVKETFANLRLFLCNLMHDSDICLMLSPKKKFACLPCSVSSLSLNKAFQTSDPLDSRVKCPPKTYYLPSMQYHQLAHLRVCVYLLTAKSEFQHRLEIFYSGSKYCCAFSKILLLDFTHLTWLVWKANSYS